MKRGSVVVTSRIPEALRKHASGMEQTLIRIGLRWQGLAKQECPVDTGRLRSSIAWATHTMQPPVMVAGDDGGAFTPPKPKPGTVLVGSNVEYAAAVHEGYPAQVVTVPRHNVREHTRTITSAFGRVIDARTVVVRAHSRGPYEMNMRERPPTKFIEGPLREHQDEWLGMIRAGVAEALK